MPKFLEKKLKKQYGSKFDTHHVTLIDHEHGKLICIFEGDAVKWKLRGDWHVEEYDASLPSSASVARTIFTREVANASLS